MERSIASPERRLCRVKFGVDLRGQSHRGLFDLSFPLTGAQLTELSGAIASAASGAPHRTTTAEEGT
jgi:hypothetical protein